MSTTTRLSSTVCTLLERPPSDLQNVRHRSKNVKNMSKHQNFTDKWPSSEFSTWTCSLRGTTPLFRPVPPCSSDDALDSTTISSTDLPSGSSNLMAHLETHLTCRATMSNLNISKLCLVGVWVYIYIIWDHKLLWFRSQPSCWVTAHCGCSRPNADDKADDRGNDQKFHLCFDSGGISRGINVMRCGWWFRWCLLVALRSLETAN